MKVALLLVSNSTGGRLALRKPSLCAEGSTVGFGFGAAFATLVAVAVGLLAGLAAGLECACNSSNSGYSGAGGGAAEQP